MATPVTPGIKSALKMTSFWLVPTLTSAVPTKVQIESASGLYVTCFLTEENVGWTVSFNKGQAPRLLCNSTQPEVLMPSTSAGADIVGIFDPQAAVGAADKKAFEFLRNGYTGYMVRRQNKANNLADTVTVGEFVDSAPVQITPAVPDQSAQTAEGVYVFRAGLAVTGDPTYNVVVA